MNSQIIDVNLAKSQPIQNVVIDSVDDQVVDLVVVNSQNTDINQVDPQPDVDAAGVVINSQNDDVNLAVAIQADVPNTVLVSETADAAAADVHDDQFYY